MDNPLTIVPEGATSEFPVLKAFQEYIDAEQAKARKRMLGLSVFFIVLLCVVIVTFVMILTTVLNRNQSLSDRLLDYALNERNRAPAPIVQQPTVQQDILKPYLERMEKEQAEMRAALEKQRKAEEAIAAEKEKKRAAEFRQMQAELAAERERSRQEREKAKKIVDKQAEIERHRRRLYPEHYGDGKAKDTSPAPKPAAPPSQPSPAPVVKPAQAKVDPLAELKPVTYFNTDDDESVPFLIETPEQNK